MDFARSITDSPDSVLFWGSNRMATSMAAYALSLRSDPNFLWLDVRGSEQQPLVRLYDPERPRAERFRTLELDALAPDESHSRESIAAVVSGEDLDPALQGLIQFLRLPRLVQTLISRKVPDKSPSVLLATSADRVAHFYIERLEATRAFIGTLKGLGVKFVASYVGPTRRDRWAFDHVFRVEGGDDQDWALATVLAECRDLPEDSAGSRPTPLREIESLLLALPVADDVEPTGSTARGAS